MPPLATTVPWVEVGVEPSLVKLIEPPLVVVVRVTVMGVAGDVPSLQPGGVKTGCAQVTE